MLAAEHLLGAGTASAASWPRSASLARLTPVRPRTSGLPQALALGARFVLGVLDHLRGLSAGLLENLLRLSLASRRLSVARSCASFRSFSARSACREAFRPIAFWRSCMAFTSGGQMNFQQNQTNTRKVMLWPMSVS
jgi:hypothetical protein